MSTETPILTHEQVFNVLYAASKGKVLEHVPIRINASPIEPSRPCFYVIDPKQYKERTKRALGSSASKRWKSIAGQSIPVAPSRETDLHERVAMHLNLQTEESLREQRNLKAVRVNKGSKSNSDETTLSPNSLISVKYQGCHGRSSEFYWSPEHDLKLGLMIKAMAKVPRIKRGADEKSKSQKPLRQRKHGFAGKLFHLVKRSDEDMDLFDEFGSLKIVTPEIKKKLQVEGVPSLVQFWKDDRRPLVANSALVKPKSSQSPPMKHKMSLDLNEIDSMNSSIASSTSFSADSPNQIPNSDLNSLAHGAMFGVQPLNLSLSPNVSSLSSLMPFLSTNLQSIAGFGSNLDLNSNLMMANFPSTFSLNSNISIDPVVISREFLMENNSLFQNLSLHDMSSMMNPFKVQSNSPKN